MIKRPLEIEDDRGKALLRMTPQPDGTLYLQCAGTMIDGYVAFYCLEREQVMELRDCLDEVLASWFCPPEPIKIDPAQVVGLNIGEAVGDYKAPEDAIERLRRQT